MLDLSQQPARVRHASRIVVLDAIGRVLLFRISPGFVEHDELWITPGGGLERGESHEQAARRELQEETGFAWPGTVRQIWTRSHQFVWKGERLEARENYYLCRLTDASPAPEMTDDREREVIAQYRWWTAAEVQQAKAVFAPRRLGELLHPLLAGILPEPPLYIGD